ncbi:MAG: carboxylating nicotinate-nucleotide diphosphorylase [Deltaproteobacteria bacterium]|nr:carboxylating nicotinate-nucleotide diphosphorylase [Deltaproteobacteria bacterium]
MTGFPEAAAERVLRAALEEDIGPGDVTTRAVVPPGTRVEARLLAKQDLVLAGLPGFVRAFELVGPGVTWTLRAADGDRVDSGTVVAVAHGDAQVLLTAERTALNLLQRLSGIATQASEWVRELDGTRARLVDTRKTTPGLRALEKYAVRVGGAANHRFGLFDGILIKDNHIRAAGGVAAAVTAARRNAPHTLKVEVEVTTLAELDQALAVGADAVLLDNMDLDTLRRAVERTAGKAVLEASGGVTRDRLRAIAQTGVDLISAGALTHSAPAADLSLLFREADDEPTA